MAAPPPVIPGTAARLPTGAGTCPERKISGAPFAGLDMERDGEVYVYWLGQA